MKKLFILILFMMLSVPYVSALTNVALKSEGGTAFVASILDEDWVTGYSWINSPAKDGASCINDGSRNTYANRCEWWPRRNDIQGQIFGVNFPKNLINKVGIYQAYRYLDQFNLEYKDEFNVWHKIGSYNLLAVNEFPNNAPPNPSGYYEDLYTFQPVLATGLRVVPTSSSAYGLQRITEIEVYEVEKGVDLFTDSLEMVKNEFRDCITPGNKVSFKASVSNSGKIESGDFKVKWYVNDVEQLDLTESIKSLGSSEQITLSLANFQFDEEGNYTIKLKIDTNNSFLETDETNNEKSDTFTVRARTILDSPIITTFIQNQEDSTVTMNGYVSNTKSIEWIWGDGSKDSGWFPQSHIYDSPGNSVKLIKARAVGECEDTISQTLVYFGSCTPETCELPPFGGDIIPEINVPLKICNNFDSAIDLNINSNEEAFYEDVGYILYLDDGFLDGGVIKAGELRKTKYLDFSSGIHNLKLVLDPNNKLKETNEVNNEIIKTINVEDCAQEISPLQAKFQIRTAPNNNGEPGKWTNWLGPGCSKGTYYTYSGQSIECNLHDGNKFIQFNVLMSESLEFYPAIEEVGINYFGKSNLEPIVSLNAQPQELFVGEDAGTTLTANTVDMDGKIVSYFWDFGDGTNLTTIENKIQHNYDIVGVYKISVEVLDDSGGKTKVKSEVYATPYDCLDGNNNIKTSGDENIYSINSIINPTDSSQSSEEVKAELISWILNEYAESRGISPKEIDTTIEYYEAVAKFVHEHMSYVLTPNCQGYGNYITAKDTFESGIDESCQVCANDFCGQCAHYSHFFTALARLLGVNEKCVYSAYGPAHAYNIINYLGKFRIYDPQTGAIGAQFDSSSLDWIGCEAGATDEFTKTYCVNYYYGMPDIDWPHYIPYMVFNDIYGSVTDSTYVGKPSNAYIYTMNYMDSDGMPDLSNKCSIVVADYDPSSINSPDVNALKGWIEKGGLTYFEDICP